MCPSVRCIIKMENKRGDFMIKMPYKKEGVYYKVVHCSKCNSICILEYEYKGNEWVGISGIGTLIFLAKILSNIPDVVKRKIKRLKRKINSGNIGNWEVPVECEHIEGMCEDCLKKEKSSVLIKKSSIIDNYREAIQNLKNEAERIYFQEERELKKELTWKYFYEKGKKDFVQFCIDKQGKSIDEKIRLAEEYIKRTNIVEYLKSKVLENESITYLKNSITKLKEQVEQEISGHQSMISVYNEVKPLLLLNERIIKTKKCPIFPNETISRCKMYKLEGKYNINKLLNKNRDEEIFSGIQSSFSRTIKDIAKKIVYADWIEEKD